MIRKMNNKDLVEVVNIWLSVNIDAHDFIDSKYWIDNKASVEVLIAQAEVYVYTSNNQILGFIGLDGNYIDGIFVSKSIQSIGIGTKLLNYVKIRKDKLDLSVYEKNNRAVDFYTREGFKIIEENFDEELNENEFIMSWKKEK